MGLGVRGFMRIGAAIAGCALVAACTPNQPPAVTPTPTPAATPSPTPSATPTETDIERRMRLDFEAAERAYRTSRSEQDRLARLGSAAATPTLRRTSTGEYLEFALSSLQRIKNSGWRTVGGVKIVGIARGGWQSNRLHLTSCEDGSSIRFIDESNKDVTPDNPVRTFIQEFTIIKVDGDWKVSELRSKRVESFDGAPCEA